MMKLYKQGVEKMSQEFDILMILQALRKEEDQVIDLDMPSDPDYQVSVELGPTRADN